MSDYETAQKGRNIIVGIFVIAGLCALSWLIFKFGDLPVLIGELKSFEVRVQFPTASGVQRNTPVQFCGYQIGRVTAVERPKVMENRKTGRFYHQTVVVLGVGNEYDDIPAGVEVKLMTRGLGSSYIELRISTPDSNQPATEFLVDGSLLQGSTGMTSEFFPEESQKKLGKLIDVTAALLNNANDVLGDEVNKENFKSALANLSEAAKQATKTLEEFQEFVVAGVNTSEELSKTMAELRLILEKVNDGQGTLAKLINDGRLYESLLENSQQLNVLMQEMKSLVKELKKKGVSLL